MTPAREARRLAASLADLPLPGRGSTACRHERLCEVGRADLSVARLVEAHTDAVAILRQAGREPVEGALYGVWAAEVPGALVEVTGNGVGTTVSGTKAFATGVDHCDAALVTAVRDDDPVLVCVDLGAARAEGTVVTDTSAWSTPAFAGTSTGSIRFDAAAVGVDAIVGGPGFYLGRSGFWQGALGPAACWAGGAIGLVDRALATHRDDAHTAAHLGALDALAWSLAAWLRAAGDEIDACPDDADHAAVVALRVRHLVERACTEVIDRAGRALGPGPLAREPDVARRVAELGLYIRQCHAERDLELLHSLRTRTRSRSRDPETAT